MLSVEDSKLKDRKLILLARFSLGYTRDKLIPEIERNCVRYQVSPQLVANFGHNKLAENSLYFHHAYAYADIPVGQEYEIIALMSKGSIIRDSILRCKTTVLAFFSAYKEQPFPHASHGHRENSLIQFQGGIPDIVFDLCEITDKTRSIADTPSICLCSYETLRANGIYDF